MPCVEVLDFFPQLFRSFAGCVERRAYKNHCEFFSAVSANDIVPARGLFQEVSQAAQQGVPFPCPVPWLVTKGSKLCAWVSWSKAQPDRLALG